MNVVHLQGRVKRRAEAVQEKDGKVLDFGLEVWAPESDRWEVIDCRCTNRDGLIDDLDGYVEEGEELYLEGRLQKRTRMSDEKLANVYLKVRMSDVIVFVDRIMEEPDEQ